MKFCPQCGTQLSPEERFCRQCGTPVASGSPASPASMPPPPAPPVTKSRAGGLILLGCLGFLVIGGVLTVAGLYYVGHKVKQKVAAVIDSGTPGGVRSPADNDRSSDNKLDADAILGKIGSLLKGSTGDGDLIQPISDTDPETPCPSAPAMPAQTNAKIPLLPETKIVTAWGVKYGDVEATDTILSVDNSFVAVDHRSDSYKDDFGRRQNVTPSHDKVCDADLQTSHTFLTVQWQHLPKIIRDTTRFRLSNAVFQEIKTGGKTHLNALDFDAQGQKAVPFSEDGDLQRVETNDVPYPLIVNDQKTMLPTIHLHGIFNIHGKDPRPVNDRPKDTVVDAYVVDDPLDPLVLLWKMADPKLHEGKFRVEMVRLQYKVAAPVNMVEQQLQENKKAITYGIYFDFNEDTIKRESEPTLKEIVQAMTDNPDWKLHVAGHTDNIGGDVYNLDLSKRRAAAVKRALVERYQIDPDRLTTDGYGSAAPIDTNETLGGRARNRRVELTRE